MNCSFLRQSRHIRTLAFFPFSVFSCKIMKVGHTVEFSDNSQVSVKTEERTSSDDGFETLLLYSFKRICPLPEISIRSVFLDLKQIKMRKKAAKTIDRASNCRGIASKLPVFPRLNKTPVRKNMAAKPR